MSKNAGGNFLSYINACNPSDTCGLRHRKPNCKSSPPAQSFHFIGRLKWGSISARPVHNTVWKSETCFEPHRYTESVDTVDYDNDLSVKMYAYSFVHSPFKMALWSMFYDEGGWLHRPSIAAFVTTIKVRTESRPHPICAYATIHLLQPQPLTGGFYSNRMKHITPFGYTISRVSLSPSRKRFQCRSCSTIIL